MTTKLGYTYCQFSITEMLQIEYIVNFIFTGKAWAAHLYHMTTVTRNLRKLLLLVILKKNYAFHR